MSALGGTLVLLRHGESITNAAGIFTGLLDVPLSVLGLKEAHRAADVLAAAHLNPAAVFASTLQRTVETARIVRHGLGSTCPVENDWRLNERNYGALTGQRKKAALAEYGEVLFESMRRSLNGTPPPMTSEQYREFRSSPMFQELPAEGLTPTESLADVVARVRPFLADQILPLIQQGQTVLVVAHGNSLRAICFALDGLSERAVGALNIPTGQPLAYYFTADGYPLNRGGTYLNPDAATSAAALVAAEGGT
ncbi:2,3-bisphosphoglycerate-dependent phosphoglycerate mutase [Curtobacterium flaccumfaciens]|jgi:2,3-bisphosphoglycerate-dependent phosphoglycerate mutase|uniref:2,3-bisphosphoglycerate-dependent phosphoglycerate mutase n=1 Tax=Curtobacterium flaccumfaciens TaxID=2035 RepID=UPI001BDE6776|nr:2,3-diphosphoglycerate-dependent phosphoglycerate mutase [Curtobacterium flaccumfaciens]MBT1631663.1 2,3-diphosphoglycerate-dependent phosphoglycerate mutase [Curtobacterium flaccumfaciens pv. oortii]MCX2844176.1 2,3-diphosphoglycerate-dependent phosphoglycerate mutase [Curtobacterium flaccumfaciens pv. oortii]